MSLITKMFVLVPLLLAACDPNAEIDGASNQPASNGQVAAASVGPTDKMCSGVLAGNYRDSITVPSGWSKTTCRNWAVSIGVNEYQLGCVFSSGYSWGPGAWTSQTALAPASNCGW